MKKIVCLFLTAISFFLSNAYSTDDKISNREIIEAIYGLKVEIAGLKAGQISLNQRIDDMNRRIDSLERRSENQLYVIITGFFIIIGLVMWDRRTTLKPAIKEINAIKQVIIKAAEKLPALKAALKQEGVF